MSAVLDFGKHEGGSLVEVVFSDPAWFVWAIRQGVFHDRGGPSLQNEAETVWFKARHIRKPQTYPAGSKVAYYYQGPKHKFSGVSIVADDGRYEEHADLSDVLDLGYVSDSGERDKLGQDLLTKAIKRIVFSGSAKVTRGMMEQFFADSDNFNLPMQEAAE